MELGKRIMVLGSSASGKSTLASYLGKLTGIDVVHLDRIFWKPGWVETPGNEMDSLIMEAASRERWIIDGNYSRTLDLRMERADTVIYIDLNRYICIFRALKRRIKNRGKTRDDMGEGCPEKIDLEFLLWIWNFPKRSREATLAKITSYFGNRRNAARILASRREVKMFLLERHTWDGAADA